MVKVRGMRTLVLIGAVILLAACGTKAPVEKEPEKKREPVRAPAVFKVRMETTEGPVITEVHRDWAPRGADHFYMLPELCTGMSPRWRAETR